MRLFFTKLDDVVDLMGEIQGRARADVRIGHDAATQLKVCRGFYTYARRCVVDNRLPNWPGYFVETYVALTLVRRDLQFAELLYQKHRRYGVEPLLDWYELGVLMRMGSKIARAENLLKDPSLATADESLEDTMTDLKGYALLGFHLNQKIPLSERH